jgi:hypothetical protein
MTIASSLLHQAHLPGLVLNNISSTIVLSVTW